MCNNMAKRHSGRRPAQRQLQFYMTPTTTKPLLLCLTIPILIGFFLISLSSKMPLRAMFRSVIPSGTRDVRPNQSEATSFNQLGLRIFAALPRANTLISPYSIAAALTLAAEGAEPSTISYQQWRAILPRPVSPITAQDSAVTLRTANAAWLGDVRDEYVGVVKKFGSEVMPLPKSVDEVNEWVSRATNGNIDTLLSDLPEPLVAILVNAVYFKAPWAIMFNKADTVTRPFLGVSDVKMMTMSKKSFPYRVVQTAVGRLQVVEMPYGSEEFSAVAVLPSKQVRLDDVVALLKNGEEEWNKWTDGLIKTELDVLEMPRFKLEFGGVSLKQVLQGMGLEKAWQPDATDPPFKRMTDDPEAYLSDVVHKASLECTEDGTTASAATAALITLRGMPMAAPRVVMDRPFLFAVRRKKGELLFIGRVDRPVEP